MISSSPLPTAFAETEAATDSEADPGIARKVRLELRRSGYAAMRRVEVNLEGDVLTLSGDVYSFHMKQTAQEIARKAVPDVNIENRLTVV